MAYYSSPPISSRSWGDNNQPLFLATLASSSSDVGQGSAHPFEYTLDEIAFLFCRVKKWRVELELHSHWQVEGGEMEIGVTRSWEVYPAGRDGSSDETIIAKSSIQNISALSGVFDDGGYIDPPFGGNSWHDINMSVSGFSITNIVLEYNGGNFVTLSAPGFGIGCNASTAPLRANVYLQPASQRTLSDFRFYRPGFQDSFVNGYLYTGDGSWDSLSGHLKILPEEYWPYDPEDVADYPGKAGSGPVYDSATGAQLRNPFAIVMKGDGTFYNPLHG